MAEDPDTNLDKLRSALSNCKTKDKVKNNSIRWK